MGVARFRLCVADDSRRAAVFISAGMEQKGMSENYVACISGNFVEIPQRFAKSFFKQIEMGDTFRMLRKHTGAYFVRFAGQDCAAPARLNLCKDTNDQQSLLLTSH